MVTISLKQRERSSGCQLMALPFVYEANGTSTRNITFSSPVETGSPPAFTGSWVAEEVFSTSQYTFFV